MALAMRAGTGDDGAMSQSPDHPETTRLSLRLMFGAASRLGPGKAALLEQIGETGSIAAAGRAMGMSYKRAWSLVEELNRDFARPLVARVRGGAGGGGTVLTPLGGEVLARYRAVEVAAWAAAAEDIAALEALLRSDE